MKKRYVYNDWLKIICSITNINPEKMLIELQLTDIIIYKEIFRKNI